MTELSLHARTPCVIGHAQADDGYPLTYRSWSPPQAPRASVVLFNGLMSHSQWFFPLADPLVDAGFAVIGADRRGSGLNTQARGDAPSAKAVIEDALAIIDAAVSAEQPLVLAGWCWGSILALNLVRPLGERVRGLVLLTPGLFPTRAVIEAATSAWAASEGAADDRAVVASPIEPSMFTHGPYLDEFIEPDPLKLLHFTPRFMAHGKRLSMGATMQLRTLKLPTLVVLAEDDEATCNDDVNGALDAVRGAPITRLVVPGRHGMQFDAPQAVTAAMAAFVNERISPRA